MTDKKDTQRSGRVIMVMLQVCWNEVHGDGRDPYYSDDELACRVEDWIEGGFDDRDDSPGVKIVGTSDVYHYELEDES